jgi:hypothetical protein
LNVMNEGGPSERRAFGEGGRSSASNNVNQARAVVVRAAGYSKRRTDLAHGTPWGGPILLGFLRRRGVAVLHVGLDLSRKRVDDL